MKKADRIREKIEYYFAQRRSPMKNRDGTPMLDENQNEVYEYTRPLTVTGLARELGFSSREEMLSVKDTKSAEAIASALLAIEEYAEEKLFFKDSFSGTKLFLSVNFPRWQSQSHERAAEEFPGEFDAWAK